MLGMFTVLTTVAKECFANWREDRIPRMAAGLAFFMAFSLGPMLMVAIFVTGLVVGGMRPVERCMVSFGRWPEFQWPAAFKNFVPLSSHPAGDAWKAAFAFLLLLIGASRVLTELRKSLNAAWGVANARTAGVWPWVRGRLLSLALVLAGTLPLLPVALDAGLETTGGSSVLADIPAFTRVLRNVTAKTFLA